MAFRTGLNKRPCSPWHQRSGYAQRMLWIRHVVACHWHIRRFEVGHRIVANQSPTIFLDSAVTTVNVPWSRAITPLLTLQPQSSTWISKNANNKGTRRFPGGQLRVGALRWESLGSTCRRDSEIAALPIGHHTFNCRLQFTIHPPGPSLLHKRPNPFLHILGPLYLLPPPIQYRVRPLLHAHTFPSCQNTHPTNNYAILHGIIISLCPLERKGKMHNLSEKTFDSKRYTALCK